MNRQILQTRSFFRQVFGDKNRIFEGVKFLGFCIFALTFWLEIGFFLGGDSTILGPKFTDLEVVFPISALGIFLIFFAHYFQKKSQNIPQKWATFCLIFLGFLAINSVFSLAPETSIWWLVIWTSAILAMAAGDNFWVFGSFKTAVFFVGILLGFLASIFKIFPQISPNILAAGAILGMYFLLVRREKSSLLQVQIPKIYQTILLIFYSLVVLNSGHLLLILFSIFWLGSAQIWRPKTRQKSENQVVFFPIFILILGLLFQIFSQKISLGVPLVFPPNFFDISEIFRVIFGFGQSQFLLALQAMSSQILLPEMLGLPRSGFLNSILEVGILGTILTALFLVLSGKFGLQKRAFFPIFFGVLWLICPEFFASESGVLFLGAFLAAR